MGRDHFTRERHPRTHSPSRDVRSGIQLKKRQRLKIIVSATSLTLDPRASTRPSGRARARMTFEMAIWCEIPKAAQLQTLYQRIELLTPIPLRPCPFPPLTLTLSPCHCEAVLPITCRNGERGFPNPIKLHLIPLIEIHHANHLAQIVPKKAFFGPPVTILLLYLFSRPLFIPVTFASTRNNRDHVKQV